jgi:16S rRNA processing protein RimM
MTAAGHDTGDFILLGKVTKPHGIRGEVKVYPYSEQPENFLAYRKVFVASGSGDEWIPYSIEKSRVQGKLVLLKLSGCSTRNAAEELVGMEIQLHRDELPEPADNEYYWLDFEGKQAVTDKGRILGRVTGIITTGAHDILAVSGDRQEYLIPVQESFIVRYDKNRVVLSLPPGLLDINKK